ncbi:MAG: hypothetical protein ABWK05_04330 [Pyrobaculum sp.]
MEVFAPTPAELIRRYGAKKLGEGERYEVSAINLPWVVKKEVRLRVTPGRSYIIDGVRVDGLEPPWEAYVALVDEAGNVGVGYIATGRRRMFKCIKKPYVALQGVQMPSYIVVRPVQLFLSDNEKVVDCIETPFDAAYVAVFLNAPLSVFSKIKVELAPVVKETFK